MTDSTQADYWALLEEITEYRGHLIHMANAIYAMIGAEARRGHDYGERVPRLRLGDLEAALALDLEAETSTGEDEGWLAPVIPLRPRGALSGQPTASLRPLPAEQFTAGRSSL
jgi:hypothetical protein